MYIQDEEDTVAILRTICVNKRTTHYDVYIGRGSKWGNPFRIRRGQTRKQVIKMYEAHVRANKYLLGCLHELKGKRLGCFCKPKPCHGDILVKLVKEFTK